MNAPMLHPAAQASPHVLRVSGLSVSFGSVRALLEVDLAVAQGELVAITGEPGAGKTTLARCIAGDLAHAAGTISLDQHSVPEDPAAAARLGIALVWQDPALCDNLDVAGNLLLGQETPRMMLSQSRFHAAARTMLRRLQIPIHDTTQLVGSLPGGQRQLVAVARAISGNPRLLVLDEPSASLGVAETGQLEELIAKLRDHGTTIILASRDIEQVFRLADRIVVLRHGKVVAELDPRRTHPDELAALLSGQEVDSTARRQLARLHVLADRLVSAHPSSSLPLILSSLGAALGSDKVCIHVVTGRSLVCAASLGFASGEISGWSQLSFGSTGGPAGRAAAEGQPVVEEDLRIGDGWPQFGDMSNSAPIVSACSVPVMGAGGVVAVITVFRPIPGEPHRDELDLLSLYAGYVASAVERDRLLDQVTARNRVLETIREMLETLTGPVSVGEGLTIALQSLRRGLQADEVGLLAAADERTGHWRAFAGSLGTDPATLSTSLRAASRHALADGRRHGVAREYGTSSGRPVLGVSFMAPAGVTILLAAWAEPRLTDEDTALIEDAAHSLRLALESEQFELAHQEAAALRRSRELQRGFLSRLSHELRTPLTAIRGYASSLMQPDVTWDGDSQQRFLRRIAAESARLGRLVDNLLDFSAIESGVMRLQRDWCDIGLVVEAAIACLPDERFPDVSVADEDPLPAVWADHDRLEQVFVNLLNNAFRHNPAGTRVTITASAVRDQPTSPRDAGPATEVEISVADDGHGFPEELVLAPFESVRRHRSHSSGAGLGLSISRGIIEAHGGRIELEPLTAGTAFRIRLPIEPSDRLTAGNGVPDSGQEDELAAVTEGRNGVAAPETQAVTSA